VHFLRQGLAPGDVGMGGYLEQYPNQYEGLAPGDVGMGGFLEQYPNQYEGLAPGDVVRPVLYSQASPVCALRT